MSFISHRIVLVVGIQYKNLYLYVILLQSAIQNYNFTVVLYGCEIRSLTLREECRLTVFKNRVLMGIVGPKNDEITGDWRRLHNEELYDLYSSLNFIQLIKSRRLKWAGHVACMGDRRVYTGFRCGFQKKDRPIGPSRRVMWGGGE
jgi:hypothetical protein